MCCLSQKRNAHTVGPLVEPLNNYAYVYSMCMHVCVICSGEAVLDIFFECADLYVQFDDTQNDICAYVDVRDLVKNL